MADTKITKGWPLPKGLCDMCNTRPALAWFGDTSVALCDNPACIEQNQRNWDAVISDADED